MRLLQDVRAALVGIVIGSLVTVVASTLPSRLAPLAVLSVAALALIATLGMLTWWSRRLDLQSVKRIRDTCTALGELVRIGNDLLLKLTVHAKLHPASQGGNLGTRVFVEGSTLGTKIELAAETHMWFDVARQAIELLLGTAMATTFKAQSGAVGNRVMPDGLDPLLHPEWTLISRSLAWLEAQIEQRCTKGEIERLQP